MRQLGTIDNESDAQRFAAYLVASGTDAHAEEELGRWAIWVRDENQLEEARGELTRFLENPRDPRYQDAERAAAARRREQEQQREKTQKNVVQMRGRWGRGTAIARRCPLTIALILLSAFVGVASNLGDVERPTTVLTQLTFCRLIPGIDGPTKIPVDGWEQIKQGQLWRLVTPIFVHFGITHLVFNMLVLYTFGAQIEDRHGTWRLGVMVLFVALLSNVAQYVWTGHPLFGGMSGVDYGLFGFVWMRMLHDRGSGLYVSPLNVFIMVGWFVLCLARELGPFQAALEPIVKNVANTAHGVGLVAGLALGFLPLLFRSRR